MVIDLNDPVITRFIGALITLTPSAWDAIDRRITSTAAAGPPIPPPPGVERTAKILAPIFDLFDPSPETLRSIMRRGSEVSSKLAVMALGPAWRRQGTGPVRRLTEVLERGYITTQLRVAVLLVILAMRVRAQEGNAEVLREIYAPFEPAIPWASLVPPLLPAGEERSAL